ncbi:ABC-2 type transport system ATP-binding protein [Desulfosalsimonas propionicica]|uniref:ABC-2 type transport system ATP-binding protein n=1 Tax=Desulfosalsimonas propionicica TaxID=332175 RepID=A0A7W0CAL8_9BACT|nr:ABC transporter ATP-binding protein [Desulfosalsimonas propionicica]MBA2882190.1 ABC-2 type transport system ATP-binding protein [Desulfosalsimonas propionicica]
MHPSILVENLSKRFENVAALSEVSFSVGRGELFGFLGPNGAGKTTTINMLTGLARPDTGTIRIAGIDCTQKNRQAQHLIGVVPDESNLYPELSGFDNLCFCAALYGMAKPDRQRRARELLADFGLKDAADRRFSGYSKGMKRKLTIAAGIIHQPEILFLDEPTTGIDVASARHLRQLIDDLHQGGTTIFLTTHYIEEAERLCDRIAFIVAGRIVEISSVADLLQPLQAKHVVEIACENPNDGITDRLSGAFAGLAFSSPKQGLIRVEADKPVKAGAIVHFLEEQGFEVSEAKKIKPSLEEVFVRITGIEANALENGNQKGNRMK